MAYISGSITEESKIIVLDSNHNKTTSKDFTLDSTGYTKLLLHFDEAILVDSCATPKTLTPYGGITSVLPKIGTNVLVFNGTNQYISIPDSADWNFGSGDFTIDFWAYTLDNQTNKYILSLGNRSSCSVEFSIFSGSARPAIFIANTAYNINTSPSFTINQWNHVAIVRYGNTITYYYNGVSVGSLSFTGTINSSGFISRIGDYIAGGYNYSGYLDEFRISKGIARWTANFTPPTSTYTTDSYTKLLLHSDVLPIVDSSIVPKTLTNNNSISLLSKFNGVGSFNGTNQYISIPDSNDWYFGSGNFTIDLWISFSSLTGVKSILGQDEGAGPTNKWVFIYNYPSTNKITFSRGATGLEYTWDLSLVINTWYHLAVVRNGNILSCYSNGVKLSSDKDITGASWPQVNAPLTIGTEGENYAWMNGYIDELRISKGVARWTSNFTPPTQAYKNPAPFMYNINGADRYAYSINNLTSTSGTVIAMSNSGEVVGYNKMSFATSQNLEATGGTISYSGSYKIHTFLSSGTFQVTSNDYNKSIDSLVIAGGGGGSNTGAGGGAGGYVYTTSGTISANSYPVVVGTGGLGGASSGAAGAKGNNSTFNGITAEGGGGGASHGSTSSESGGCGAGGAIKTSGSPTPGGVGRQGYNGGQGYISASWAGGCGGGGGAGQAGEAGSFSGGKGGDGLANSITGTSITYAGGGGGGEVNGTAGGAYGGAGGGGRANSDAAGSNGTNGLGGGGGGGSYNVAYYNGGNGGSGVVIIRYLYQ
jgi:hypothetical protein